MDFEHRIIALRSEIEALKTTRRKSSSTLTTITKTVTCTAQLKNVSNVILCRRAGALAIVPTDGSTNFLYSVALQPYSSRGRDVRTTNWLFNDGAVGVMCVPDASDLDDNLADGSTKNVTITVYITATCDFTTEASQIVYNEV